MRLSTALTAAPIWCFLIAAAQANSPEIGWRANLETHHHEVSGTVTIVDADTVQVDDFTYDGKGVIVYFYLGVDDSTAAFTNGLSIGDQLVGSVYDGSQEPLVISLPGGETIDGYHAISVWCVDVSVSFGNGTFRPTADFTSDGAVTTADLQKWRGAYGANATADANLDGVSSGVDFLAWQQQHGEGILQIVAVPEPTNWLLAACAAIAKSIHAAFSTRARSAVNASVK